jgi:chromodomain-containing protein
MAYRLDLPPLIKVHDVFHINLLTPYKEMEEYGQAYMRPPPIIVQSEEEYEVESILQAQHKGPGDLLEYKVHWKGYPFTNDLWVPHEDLHSPNLLKEFYAQGGKVQAIKRRRERLQRIISSLLCLPPAVVQTTSLKTSHPLLITTKDPPWSCRQTKPPSSRYKGQWSILPTLYKRSPCLTLETRRMTVTKNESDKGKSCMSQYKSFAMTTKQETPPRTSSIHPPEWSAATSSLQDSTTKPHGPQDRPSSTASYKSSVYTPFMTLRTAHQPPHPPLTWINRLQSGIPRCCWPHSQNWTSSDHPDLQHHTNHILGHRPPTSTIIPAY